MDSPDVTRTAESAAIDWPVLAQRRIFFGHQSVGYNIVAGMKSVLDEHPEVPFKVVETTDPSAVGGAGFFHAAIGRNYDPASKTEQFDAIVDHGIAGDRPIAMYKYCFVDMESSTDPARLFETYRDSMAALAARHPEVAFVQVTMPLMTAAPSTGLKHFVKGLLGRGEGAEVPLNVKRNAFNALVRAEYGPRGTLFDLASLESTREDGSRSFFMQGSDTVYTLVPEYSTDGGHLNARASRRIATALLAFLSRR